MEVTQALYTVAGFIGWLTFCYWTAFFIARGAARGRGRFSITLVLKNFKGNK